MSDTKASAFGVIPALDRAADYVPILDMSASAGSNDRNKLITPDALFTGITTAAFRDTSAAFDVTQTFTSSTALDAARSITWDVKNASHQLKFTAASIVTFPSGTVTLAQLGANTFTGVQIVPVGSASAPSIGFTGDTGTGWFQRVSGYIMGAISGSERFLLSTSQVLIPSANSYAFNSQDNTTAGGADTHIMRRAAAYVGLGQPSSTPVAQTFGGAPGAGFSNITGGTLNIGTQGTGTGTGGIINFQSHAAGASGSTLGTLVTVASTLSDRFKVASGMLLQIGNAAATEALVCDKSIQFLDSTGTAYKVPCVAA